MKKVAALLLVLVMVIGLSACGEEKKESVKAEDSGEAQQETITLKMAHNSPEEHPVHLALVRFAELVQEKTNGSVKVDIFPNGQLGSESEVLEQLQAGAVAMTKVSAAALTSYYDGYNAFTLPYVFDSEEHFIKCMESDMVKDLYSKTEELGFIGLTYYTSGARSFYTKDTPILKPEDLNGLKIRVMGFPSQTEMVEILGGTPVGLPVSEVYTSLQSGVIDGAESNETVLTYGKHGEVTKKFSWDEHTRIPDIIIISSKIWNTLDDTQKEAVREAAAESTVYHTGLWGDITTQSIEEAKEMGVEFYEVDKAPFKEAVQPMIEKYENDMPEVKELLDAFKEIQ